jgi:hypothetical protein
MTSEESASARTSEAKARSEVEVAKRERIGRMRKRAKRRDEEHLKFKVFLRVRTADV